MKTFNLISDILISSQCRFAANCLASQTEHPRQMHLEALEYIKSSSKFLKTLVDNSSTQSAKSSRVSSACCFIVVILPEPFLEFLLRQIFYQISEEGN